MENNKIITAAFTSLILLSATGATQLVNLVAANPFLYEQVSYPISPPPEVEPPSISIVTPKNDTALISGNVSLNFNLTVTIPVMPELFYYYLGLSDVYYKASWLPNNSHLDLTEIESSIPTRTRTFSEDSVAKWGTYWTLSGYALNPKFSINLTDIPEGPQSIEVFAVESGSRKYSQKGITIRYGRYALAASSVVQFAVDSIITLAPQNKTYEASDVPLLFEAPDYLKQISYSLDGQSRIMISGNTTLTGLSNGYHNLTVFAMDVAGNVGASETIIFAIAESQAEPLPTDLVAASAASIIVFGAVLLVYFGKRKR